MYIILVYYDILPYRILKYILIPVCEKAPNFKNNCKIFYINHSRSSNSVAIAIRVDRVFIVEADIECLSWQHPKEPP